MKQEPAVLRYILALNEVPNSTLTALQRFQRLQRLKIAVDIQILEIGTKIKKNKQFTLLLLPQWHHS